MHFYKKWLQMLFIEQLVWSKVKFNYLINLSSLFFQQLLPENMGDVDLLSILGQSDNAQSNNENDELLSLFDT